MNSTMRRILTGTGISLFASVTFLATIIPSGASGGPVDNPATPPAPAVAPEVGATPVVEEPTTTTTAKPPTAIVTPARVAAAVSGHYTCPASQDDQFHMSCTKDTVVDPGPNLGSDVPELMAGAGDDAYNRDMVDQFCAVKPVVCEDGRP